MTSDQATRPVVGAAEERAEIEQLLADYAWGADRKDFTLLERCFAPAASVTFAGGEPLVGRDAVLGFMRERTGALPASMHEISTVRISADQEGELEARSVTSYCTASLLLPEADGHAVNRRTMYYADRLVRRDGRWVIAERVQHLLWVEGPSAATR